MTRVLVTGATGLIGRAVVPLLRDAGCDVVTTSRSAGGENHLPANLAERPEVDRLLREARPQALLHLAGGPAPDAASLVRNNVDATSTLLQALLAAREVPLQRLIVTGSAAEYGAGQGAPIPENAPAAPVTDYGRAKLAQRMIVQAMAQQVARITVLARPFNVVAADMSAATPLGNLRRQLARAGEGGRVAVSCGRLDLVRDFLSIRSIAEALVALLDLENPPAAINLCSGRPTLMSELFEVVAQQSGRVVSFVPDEQLARLPAASSVIGDPRLAQTLGLVAPQTVDELASTLLEGLPADAEPAEATAG